MDVRKILQDLQYRINTTPESDQERGNAIRLRDRFLARLGLSMDDIIIVRTPDLASRRLWRLPPPWLILFSRLAA